MNSDLVISNVVGLFAETELRKFYRAAEIGSSQLIITDSTGTIEYVNPAFTRVTGYSYEEAVGKTPALLKSGRMPAAFYEQMWETLLSGSDWSGELYNRRKDGSFYIDKAVISGIKGSNGTISHFIKVAEDITSQRNAEEHQQHRFKLIEAINAANLHFIENGNMSHMAGIILETCMTVTSSPLAILYELLPNGGARILSLATTSLDPVSAVSGFRDIQYEIMRHGHYDVPLHASLFMAPVNENRTIVVNSPEENRWKECCCRMCSPAVTTFAGFPLKSGSGVIGMIGIANSEHGYSADDILDFEAFASSCSLALSAARTETIRKATQDQLRQ